MNISFSSVQELNLCTQGVENFLRLLIILLSILPLPVWPRHIPGESYIFFYFISFNKYFFR